MKPCDIKNKIDWNKLSEHGLSFNQRKIEIHPGWVKIINGSCEMKLPKNTFKAFAEWYLEDQNKSSRSIHGDEEEFNNGMGW